jgi:hypothetical protein
VDSSLLDAWEKMRAPGGPQREAGEEVRPPGAEDAAADITRDRRAFIAAVRTLIFTFLRGCVVGDYEGALASVTVPAGDASANPSSPEAWTPDRLSQALDAYYVEHEQLCLDPNARNVRNTYVLPSEDQRTWRVQQMLIDPEGHNDWVAEFEVDLPQSRERNAPLIRLLRFGSLTQPN